jgi:hypothetical protein
MSELTDDQLAAIRAQTDATTPEPWRVGANVGMSDDALAADDADCHHTARWRMAAEWAADGRGVLRGVVVEK